MEPTHRAGLRLLTAMALLLPSHALAKSPAGGRRAPEASIAFARYIATVQAPNPFTQSAPVAIEIEASLPGAYRQSRLMALRRMGESQRSEYLLLGIEGDATVVEE